MLRALSPRLALRLLPLLALLAFATFIGVGPATEEAEASGPIIGGGSCLTAGSCTGHIGADSCNGVDACDFNAGTIGDSSCNATNACAQNGGTVGDNSCNGHNACFVNAGTIGGSSCNGLNACFLNGASSGSGTVGDGSCNGNDACLRNGVLGSGTVGDGSCNGNQACLDNGRSGSGTVGDDSCNGDNACYLNGYLTPGAVGQHSCNGDDQCPQAVTTAPPGVGDCAANLPGHVPPPCNGPVVTATFTDQSTGPPTSLARGRGGRVLVAFVCEGGSGGDQGRGNTYPRTVRVTRTTLLALSYRWHCVDADGNAADAPAGFPASIKIDRKAPACTVVLSRTKLPRVGTPTLVTASVNGADADSGVASKRIIAISPAPQSGDALPDASPGSWMLVGASGKVFTFTGEVRDDAGNVSTCTKKVVSR